MIPDERMIPSYHTFVSGMASARVAFDTYLLSAQLLAEEQGSPQLIF